ncbi:A-kinase anchor protein 17B [Sorex araneus]|uniref:A-kinase anchor protein 17B n=1 Tax=Sorex araneus TaxID=42254 RepID=UPI0003316D2F|nr:A-kinase anchor protein 17B [Sorex araneus]XP_054977604.1 A-kinase anchor protein 17B [Sorex araneus]XP_054977605.1 A-kinase anchor protein 17B [Sorex araneus]
MMITVVYDNSEATELCAAQHLYLKPIAKLMIKVLLPESTEILRHFSNWEILDQLKSLICPDQFTTVRLSKSTKDFIRFEGEAETLSLVQILKAKLHGKIIKLSGLKTELKVVATDAQGEWEHFPKDKEALSSDEGEDQDHNTSPDSIYFEGLPCKWFAPKGSSGEKPCEEILRVVFESFGKIKNVDIPMLDPYREVMTGESFGSFSLGLQTFEAFVQYQESTDFVKAMESLHGMKLMLKGDDGKALACNIKVMFDTTKHFSEGAIQRRNQERLKLQELEEERKKEKKREEAEAERKRKEERKVLEKKKKARVRKRGLEEKERNRLSKSDRAKAESPQEPNSSEEWEERKYLLTQRRVEAFRLLQMLLRKISGTLFPSPPLVLGATHLKSQEAHFAGPKTNSALGHTLETWENKELHLPYLPKQNKIPKDHVAKLGKKQEKKIMVDVHKSSHQVGGKRGRYSPRKETMKNIATNRRNHNFLTDQESLEIKLIHHNFLEEEDLNKILFEQDHSKKLKVYETDEFTNYLLNHYQSPSYTRICLEPSYTGYQWKRVVYSTKDGFQINLNKFDSYSTNCRSVQNVQGEKQVQKFDSEIKSSTQSPVHTLQKRGKWGHSKESAVGFHYKETDNEADRLLPLTKEKGHLLEKPRANEVKKFRSIKESPVSLRSRPTNINFELKDFLEEISSDSEYFSEKEEKKGSYKGNYQSSPKKNFPDINKFNPHYQEKRSNQRYYSERKYDCEEPVGHNFRQPVRRVNYKMAQTRRDNAKYFKRSGVYKFRKRVMPVINYMFYEVNCWEYSSSNLFHGNTRERRRSQVNTCNQYMTHKLPYMSKTSYRCANGFYMGNFPERKAIPWQSEYNKDVRFQQSVNPNYMLNDDCNVQYNSDSYTDNRNDYNRSFYLKNV